MGQLSGTISVGDKMKHEIIWELRKLPEGDFYFVEDTWSSAVGISRNLRLAKALYFQQLAEVYREWSRE